MIRHPGSTLPVALGFLLLVGCAQPLGSQVATSDSGALDDTQAADYRFRSPKRSPSPTPTPRPTATPTVKPTATPTATPTPTPKASATPTAAPSAPVGGVPDLGANASLHGKQVFAGSSAWNQAVDTAAVDPNSAALIASIGNDLTLHPDFGANWNGGPFGIPYVVVSGSQAKVPMTFDYADESDPGPYPMPTNAPIEGGASSDGDRHVIAVDRDNWKLYEIWRGFPSGSGWKAGSGATFDLKTDAKRPAGWTSADAAGLPVFPGLVRYDEVMELKAIRHALRFTVQRTRKAYVAPATHFASSDTSASLPPMGMRVRLKASYDISGFPPEAQVVLKALKTYGMFVADNGSNWYLSGAPDARWNDTALGTLKKVKGSAFEVVKMGTVVTR